MNRIFKFSALVIGSLALITGSVQAGAPESKDPIKLAINEWTGQHVTTHIAGTILQRMGYNVEYVTAGYYPQLTAMEDGTITATLEIWSSNIGDGYQKALDSGNVEVIGDLGIQPREAWMYPSYMEEICPGLPDWKAINKCADKLATADTIPKGRFLDYPADWGTTNQDRIKSLGLNLKAIPAGSEGALISEIKAAKATKRPLLMMFWKPHWMHALHDLKIVELPKYAPECFTDKSWGINKDETYDCDWDDTAHIDKMAWVGMKKKWPAAYKLLKAYRLTNAQQEPIMKAVDVDKKKLKDAVAAWVDANEAIWKPWVDAANM